MEESKIKDIFAKHIMRIRKSKNLTQKEFGEIIGVGVSTVSDWEKAKKLPRSGAIEKIAKVFNVSKSSLFEEEREVFQNQNIIMLPIVGQISCGNGILAYEHIEGYEPTPVDWVKGGDYFYLRAKGDSMTSARIYDGDLLLIRKQEGIEDGQIAAVMIEDEAVLKRVYKRDGTIILQSENVFYPPIVLTNDITIIGKLKMNVIKY